ncbi:MAG: hypothetical protein JSR81_15940, partial [Proteobacteria bacterium]|nr:hypothetical protein [Pseudomonadota bacterium]
ENFGFAMFLKGPHKLVVYEDDLEPVQFFDMDTDPAENQNILADPAYLHIVTELMDHYVRPFFKVKAQRPHADIVKRRAARVTFG